MEHGKPYPSADQMVRDYVAAGIQPSKIVLGLAFYGYVWTGIDGPRESIATVKQATSTTARTTPWSWTSTTRPPLTTGIRSPMRLT